MDYFAFLQEKFEPPTFTDFSKISTPYKYGSPCYVENYARKHVEKLSYQILNEFNSISTRKHKRQYRLYQRCLISNHKDIISQVHDFKSLKDTGTSDLISLSFSDLKSGTLYIFLSIYTALIPNLLG